MDSEEQDQVRLTDIFSLNKPKDIKVGTSCGDCITQPMLL
jgi:hypothetical protein